MWLLITPLLHQPQPVAALVVVRVVVALVAPVLAAPRTPDAQWVSQRVAAPGT